LHVLYITLTLFVSFDSGTTLMT